MGEAKRRGTFEERQAQAQARQKKKRAEKLKQRAQETGKNRSLALRLAVASGLLVGNLKK